MYETESNAGLLKKYLKCRDLEDDLEEIEALESAVLGRMLDASERKLVSESLGGIKEMAKARAIVEKLSR